MIQLHTFGDALIRVGGKEIRPSAPIVFAALLYLCVERGRRVPRAALQEMLFPETDERSGAHSLRQLLYKLRQLGVPLDTDASSVQLPADAVQANGANGGGTSAVVLAGYEPAVSDDFRRWLDSYRAQEAAAARAELLQQLASARATGDSATALRLSGTLLEIDPLNETATYARAEALALGGQKYEAVRLLEEYAEEVGAVSPALRLSADVLRKRITERSVLSERPSIPMLGRQNELAELLGHFDRAAAGTPTMSVIWGEPGIGKTRLVQEYRAHIAMRSAVVELAHCRPHDTGRPLGAMIDIVPRLLQARGALAVSPEAMTDLRRLVGPATELGPTGESSEIVAARIRTALEDLVVSVASEAPVVLIVEDAHWLDEVSQTFLHLLLEQECRLHVILTRRTQPQLRAGMRWSEHWFSRQLEPLSPADAQQLLVHAVGYGGKLQPELTEHCVALAAGNALFLCTIAEHLRQNGAAPPSKATLTDLLRQRVKLLTPTALLLLRFVAALGVHGTQARLRQSLQLSDGDVLLALQECAERGLIQQFGETLKCSHDLLSELVLTELPPPVRVAVMANVARTLEREGESSRAIALLWACADCWRQAANSSRATEVLVRCAQLAMEIGQPVFAVEALERAQDISDGAARLSLIEDTIRAADEATMSDAVQHNVARLRSAREALGLDPNASTVGAFALINDRRRSVIPIWDDREVLRRCALDPMAHPLDRLKAGRIFLLAAEEELALGEGQSLYLELCADLAHLKDTGNTYYLQLELTYETIFGDLMKAADISRRLLRVQDQNLGRFTLNIASYVAFALFRAGDCRTSIEIFLRAIADCETWKVGHPSLVNNCDQLAMIAILASDRQLSEQYHQKSIGYCATAGIRPSPTTIVNRIDYAIADGDPETIKVLCNTLRNDFGRYFTPNRERITTAHEILADILLGNEISKEREANARRLYEIGRDFCDCDSLALAIGLVQACRRTPERGADFLGNYLDCHRRERYPFPRHYRATAAKFGVWPIGKA